MAGYSIYPYIVPLIVIQLSCLPRIFVSTIPVANITVNLHQPVHVTNEKFLSLGMDSNLVKNRWQTFDFNSTLLKTLAAGLAPAYLRLMGTDGDGMVFLRHSQHNSTLKKTPYWAYPKSPFFFTTDDWDSINNFVAAVGWRLLFGINAQTRFQTRDNKTVWDPSNAVELLQYSIQKGYNKYLDFEFGNEPDIWQYFPDRFIPVPPEQLALEFVYMKEILSNQFYDSFEGSLFVGPDTAGFDQELISKFLPEAGDVIDAVTWHFYYDPPDDPILYIHNFTDPVLLDSVIDVIKLSVETVKNQSGSDKKVWLGETSSVGSQAHHNDLCERYLAGFMLIDKLGLSARMGLDLVVRQTFFGFWFALVDAEFFPRPNYWLALLYKQLVGTHVLDVQVSVTGVSNVPARLRVYGHCTAPRSGYQDGSVVIYAMNLFNQSIKLNFEESHMFQNLHVIDQYLLMPPNNNITSVNIMLNDWVIKMVDDHTLPSLKPKLIKPSDVVLPSYGIAYYVFNNVGAKACM